MNIAIDISPLEKEHGVRGVGSYLRSLQKALQEYSTQHSYTFFRRPSEIPHNTDLVHYPYFDPFVVHLPLHKTYPTVVTIHDVIPLVFPDHFPAGVKGEVKLWIQKKLLKGVKGIITDSKASKKDIVHFLDIDENRIDTVYLAADERFKQLALTTKEKNEIRKKYNLPETFCLYVGDVTWNKNLPMLVRAMEKTKIPLIMAGKALTSTYDESNIWNLDIHEVHALIKNDRNFKLLGFVPDEDVVKLYNMATCFVFPSRYEGFGLPVLEAMQSGCPVITTKSGSLAEVAGDACFFVDPNNEKELEDAVRSVSQAVLLQKSLQKRGLQQAKKFSWKNMAQETVKVYEKYAH